MKRNKIVALALAGTLTVIAMLAGTYAWNSFDHIATNEVIDVTNPGGRLHDDFNFTANGNKDVYVENFTTTAEKGTQIYARIRLDEYMEIGAKAGQLGLTAADGKEVKIIQEPDDLTAPELEDTGEWTTYLWEREKYLEDGGTIATKADEFSEFRKYILWEFGGQTYYMPTFNRNKDSLESDINGTLEGNDGFRPGDANDTNDPYSDYIEYTATGIQMSGYEIYDADTDPTDELEALKTAGLSIDRIITELTDTTTGLLSGTIPSCSIDIDGDTTTDVTILVEPVMDAAGSTVEALKLNLDSAIEASTPNAVVDYDIKIAEKTDHETKQTLPASLVSMEKWKAPVASGGLDSAPGNYWVYDEDGWVYWANPIDPETATGLLLDAIKVRPDADLTEEYYYGINVVAQFATAGDWGTGEFTTIAADGTVIKPTTNGTGFYEDGITENGLYLLETIRSAEKTVTISTLTMPTGGLNGDAANNTNTATFKASVQQGAAVLAESVTWDVEGETSTDTVIVTEADGTGKLTIGATESADSITVVAKTTGTDVAIGTLLVPIGDYYEITIAMEQPAGTAAVSAQTTEPAGYIGQGSNRTFKAEVKKNGVVNYDVGVTWQVSGNDPTKKTEITTGGELRIASDETVGGTLTVTAVCREDNVTTSNAITVGPVMGVYDYINLMDAGTTETITIDGYDWYVMAKDNSDGQTKALLWASDNVKVGGTLVQMPFNLDTGSSYATGNEWSGSTMQRYLNNDFYDTLKTLKAADIIETTTLYTRKEFDVNNEDLEEGVNLIKTEDKVFLFSEADLFGSINTGLDLQKTAESKDYTYGGGMIVPNDNAELANKLRGSSTGWYWLRSPRVYMDSVAVCGSYSIIGETLYGRTEGCLRPALWINLSSVITPNTGQ